MSCLIAAVITTAPTEKAALAATKAVDKKKHVKHGAAPQTKAQTPTPEPVVQQPKAQEPEPNVAVPLPEEQTSKPDTAPVVRQPEAQEPGPNTAAPDDQKSKSNVVAPRPEALKEKPESEAVVRQPGAQKSSLKATDLQVPQLVLPADMARKVGQKFWLNETNGNRDAITSWNANEGFASLGIGHFIWFPAGKTATFEESFPLALEFMRKEGTQLPSWLDKTPIPPCPWMNRADFMKNFNSPLMKQLRKFLLDTMAEQTQFLVARTQGAMDKILESTPNDAEREHVITQFSRIVGASKDLYPLIDYVNFKGEGTNPGETAVDKQTGERQGWGLKQVLLKMNGTTSDRTAVLAEFADAARFVLQQRVRNVPADRVWEAGWLDRVKTYRRPIADLEESTPKRAGNESVRAKAVKRQ